MYQLEEISFLYFLVLLPILFLIFIFNKNWQNIVIKKYFESNTIDYLSPEISNKKPFLKFLIKLISSRSSVGKIYSIKSEFFLFSFH